MRCNICGANVEITEFDDGYVLIRQDCICDFSKKDKIKELKYVVLKGG